MPGGDQRPAPLGRLDHDHPQRQAADQPVPLREHAGQRLPARRRLAHQRPVGGDLFGQFVVFRRIDVQHAAGQHGDGPPAGRQGAAVGGGVDAAGQAADDGQSRPGQSAGQPLRLPQAVLGAVPRADDADGQGVVRLHFAADEQHAGRIVNLPQAPADRRRRPR